MKRFRLDFSGSVILTEYEIWPEEGQQPAHPPTAADVRAAMAAVGDPDDILDQWILGSYLTCDVVEVAK